MSRGYSCKTPRHWSRLEVSIVYTCWETCRLAETSWAMPVLLLLPWPPLEAPMPRQQATPSSPSSLLHIQADFWGETRLVQEPSIFLCSPRCWEGKQCSHRKCSAHQVSTFSVAHRQQPRLLRPEAGFHQDSVTQPQHLFAIAPAAEERVVPDLNDFH